MLASLLLVQVDYLVQPTALLPLAYLVLLMAQTYLVQLTALVFLVQLTAQAYLVLLTAQASLAQVVALVLGYCHSVPCSGTCGSLGWPWWCTH